MSKKAALQKRLAELQAEGTKILDAAESAERGLTAEEELRFEAIEDEIKAVQSDIKEAEKMEARKHSKLFYSKRGFSKAVRVVNRNPMKVRLWLGS